MNPPTMNTVVKTLLYLTIFFTIRGLSSVLVGLLLSSPDGRETWWTATVIALGCMGAAFTILHSRREEG
jgi:hypothetical protein